MTELLQRAIAAIALLPADVQDAIAARLLAEVDDENSWTDRFDATTDAQWDRIADLARRSISSQPTTPIEQVFPPPSS